MKLNQYILYFLYGGILVSLSKYLSTKVNIMYVPLVAGIPIGLLFSKLLETREQQYNYFIGYLIHTAVIVFISVFILFMLRNTNQDFDICISIGILLWIVLSISIINYNK